MDSEPYTPLSSQEKYELLDIARRALVGYFTEGHLPLVQPRSAGLLEKRGAFVTLEKGKDLRGCIGHLEADKPLYLVVQEMAVEAATGDPRFDPVRAEEIPLLIIEISVLSPMREVRSPSDIRVGEHGLVVSQGGRRGLLLPQVAEREGWDAETFLSQTCRKAGLPMDAWRSRKTKIEVFSAEVFGEGGTRST